MRLFPTLALVLVIIGAINWGLIGLGEIMGGQNWNVLAQLFDQWPEVLFTSYIVIGISGVWVVFDWYLNSGNKKRK